jgi:PPOX class probable F420-dependent enzyme
MTREQIEAFLAEPRNAMVAAIRASGMPQMTPNWFYWDGARFYISTTKTRRKYANLRRDPRVQLAIDDPTSFRTIILDGTVEIWDDIEVALPFFKKITGKHRGQVPDDDTVRRRLIAEQRVLLVITPNKPPEQWTRWGP